MMSQNMLKTVASDHIFEIPAEIAVCPYCDAKLYASCEAWTQIDNGSWIAEQLSIDCETEPDIEAPRWDEWFTTHSEMPYVYQLPVDTKVEKWVNTNFRFEVE